MKLKELKNVLKMELDFTDDVIDATFYVELSEINPLFLGKIEVVGIGCKYITCSFTKFIMSNKKLVKKYLLEYYNDNSTRNWLMGELLKGNLDNHTHELSEALYYFIEYDLADFLTMDFE